MDFSIELIKQIKSSFSKAEYPGDEFIVYNNTGNHLECNKVKNAFQGKKWDDVSFEIIRENESCLSFFSDEGLSYYIPVFLIECIKNYNRYDVLVDNIVFHLTLPTEIDFRLSAFKIGNNTNPNLDMKNYLENALDNINLKIHNFVKQMSCFDKRQGNAISQFLHYLQTYKQEDFPNNKPMIANYRYWFQYYNKEGSK